MTIFLTADTHFGHAAILRHCNRPFASVDEMDQQLVARWNERVGKGDVVWHLGDFAFVGSARTAELWHALNGEKHLILGNHDIDKSGAVNKNLSRLPWASIGRAAEINHDGQRIMLSHYAGLVWNASHHGAYLAFGHSHGELIGMPGSVDVGVDPQGYAPISAEEFVRQADQSLQVAEERIEQVIDQLIARLPQWQERAEAIRYRSDDRGQSMSPESSSRFRDKDMRENEELKHRARS